MHFHKLLFVGSCALGTALLAADLPGTSFAAIPDPQNNGRPQGGQPGNNRPSPGQQTGGRPSRPSQGGTKPAPTPQRPASPQQNRQPARANPGRPPAQHRPARPNRPQYSFGDGGNGFRLRRYFNADMGRLNRNRRHRFLVGGYFPRQYVTYLQPIPPDIMGYLPPVPPGYALGYYDGYTVVYDPTTYLIASVLDLFRY